MCGWSGSMAQGRLSQVPGCNTGKPATENLGQNEARCCRVEICAWCVVGVHGLRWGVAAGESISLSY